MGTRRPQMCAGCGKLIGLATVCPYCGVDNNKLGLRLKRIVNRAGGAGGLSVTSGFIIVNVFLALTVMGVGGTTAGGGMEFLRFDPAVLFQLGLQDHRAIDAGQWWRIVTPVFLHLGITHVVMNCAVLWYAGRFLESDVGGRLTFLIYMAAGILGFAASYVFQNDGGGASGAVSGLLGALLVRRWLQDRHFRDPVTRWVLSLIALTVVFGVLVPAVNNVAHAGGFLTGALLGGALSKAGRSRLWAVTLMLSQVLVTAVTALALIFAVLALFRGGPADFAAAQECWQKVAQTATSGHLDEIKTGRACLEALATLEEPAEEARETALRVLADWDAGWARRDASAVRIAQSELKAAVNRYSQWKVEAAPRYAHISRAE